MTKYPGLIVGGAVGIVLVVAAIRYVGRSNSESPTDALRRSGSRRDASSSEPGWSVQQGRSAPSRASGVVDAARTGSAATGESAQVAGVPLAQPGGAVPAGMRASAGERSSRADPHDGDAIHVDSTLPGAALAAARRAKRLSGATNDGDGAVHDATDTAPAQTGQEVPAVEHVPTYDSGADARFSTAAQFEVPDAGKVTAASGTVSLWLQPGWTDRNQDDASLVELGEGGLHIFKNVNFLRFEFTDSTGAPHGAGTNIDAWKGGEWHNVTATWGDGVISFYVDGQAVGERIVSQLDVPPGTKLLIGSDYPPSRPVAPGALGSVQVYDRPSTSGEVAARVAQSPLAAHQ